MNLSRAPMLRLVCLTLSLVIVSAYAAQATHDEDLWQDCEDDAECVIIMGGCDWTAVNADFQSPADEYFTEMRTRIRCFKAPGPKPESAICEKGKCVPVVVTPPATP